MNRPACDICSYLVCDHKPSESQVRAVIERYNKENPAKKKFDWSQTLHEVAIAILQIYLVRR